MYDAAARESSLEEAGLGDLAREMARKQAEPEAQRKEQLAKADFERRQEKNMAEASAKWGGSFAREMAKKQGDQMKEQLAKAARREELEAERQERASKKSITNIMNISLSLPLQQARQHLAVDPAQGYHYLTWYTH